jgi:ATP-dependent RNA helicase DDX6/DHH1
MDEADKLLSPEFMILIDRLISYTPAERQLMCFSATFPKGVAEFRDRYMTNAYEINLMEELTLKGVSQFYAFVDEKQKVHCLNTLFAKVMPL